MAYASSPSVAARLSRKISKKRSLRNEIKSCRNGELTSFPPEPGGPTINACAIVGSSSTAFASRNYSRIIQGDFCTVGDSPVVYLIARNSGGTPIFTCSGTVVSDNAVISAAHCVDSDVSSYDIVTGLGTFTSTSFIAHPDYNSFSGSENNDVSVIFSNQPLPTQKVTILRNNNFTIGELFVIAGYGLDEFEDSGSLKAGTMNINSATISSIGAIYNGTHSNTCLGDSGGPALVARNNIWVLAGVTSNGLIADCGVSNPYDNSFFANISDPSNLSFFDTYIP